MKKKAFSFIILSLVYTYTFSQNLDANKLDHYFNTLEKRNDAMGSILISQNGKQIYTKTIGYSSIKGEVKTQSNSESIYKIWSITKSYTAVMIFQLIEEGKLSLKTSLDTFFPKIPNANKITIKQMLSHRSGIFDYVNDTNESIDITNKSNKNEFIKLLATFKPNFEPDKEFRYSNSNYLLLGYIIELLDESSYETSLHERIVAKINLKDTHFGTQTIASLTNTTNTYEYEGYWKLSANESTFKEHLETADGGIVSTTRDMVLFIEALFNERLISKQSLSKMIEGEGFYRLGLMKRQFENKEGFGHTGGWVSESSLFHYPEDKLTIAYVTNGIVINKDEIINNVLKIYYKQPFAISINRNLHILLALIFGLLFYLLLKFKFHYLLNPKQLKYLGLAIALLFWIGSFIAGSFYENYRHLRDNVSLLSSFYSVSGTFMTSILLIISLIFVPYLYWGYKLCRQLKMNILPLIPLLFIPISMTGASIFPFPSLLYQIFANAIIFALLSPLLAAILWWKKKFSIINTLSLICLFFMSLSISMILYRSFNPEFDQTYFGSIQRLHYLGWTLWVTFLGYSLPRSNKILTS